MTQRIKEAQSPAAATLSDAQSSARSLTNHIALLAVLIISLFRHPVRLSGRHGLCSAG